MSRFRKVYRELTDGERSAVETVKDLAEGFDDFIDVELDVTSISDGDKRRQLSLARTRLEEAVMWYTKAVTG